MQRCALVSGRHGIRLVPDTQPAFIGVNPLNGRIGRKADGKRVAPGSASS